MIKRYIFLILGMALLTLPVACSQPPDEVVPGVDLPSSRGRGQPEFELATDFPAVPDMMTVYRVIPPDITAEWVTELGKKFGFTGEAQPTPYDEITMSDKETGASLKVYTNSGGIAYNSDRDRSTLYAKNPTLPSYEEAERIATDFLTEKGLLPPDMHVGYVGRGGSQNGVVTHLMVSFRYTIGGMPVTGTGTKYGVRIGDKGKVGRVMLLRRQVEPYKDIPIKSPAEAYQELKEGKPDTGDEYIPEIPGARSISAKVVIDKMYLAYWMEAIVDKQEYAAPVYKFEGERFDEDGNSQGDFLFGCVRAVK